MNSQRGFIAYFTGSKGDTGFGASSTSYDVAKQYGSEIKGKVVLVTGCNSGIGVHTVKALAQQGAIVVMACRSKEGMAKVAADIKTETPDSTVHQLICDLTSFESVRQCANDFEALKLPLNVLINNAGIMMPPFGLTKDGFEQQIGTNHFGHFLLTNLLAKKLKEGAPSRVVCVASIGHQFAPEGGILWDHLKNDSKYSAIKYYGQSKLANMLHAYELNKRFSGSNITAVSLHPGSINTNLGRHSTLAKVVYMFLHFFNKSESQGAGTNVYCAFGPVEAGGYYADCNLDKPNHKSYTLEVAEKLWNVSKEATNSDFAV